MCKVGGPRCSGSHTPSSAQRARRKANNAYRNAVAEAIQRNTGDDDLARRVKHANMTDLHDIVTTAGLDAERIAKGCGTATYTSPGGEITTVDVEPAGTVRRTPISDETKALLEDVDDAMTTLPGGPYREAVLSGDRKAVEELESEANEKIAAALDRAANMDFDTASDDEVAEALNQLSDLDDFAVAMRGRGFEFSEDDGSYQVWDRIKDEHDRRAGGGDYLGELGVSADDLGPDNVGDVADSLNDLVRNKDVRTMSESEFLKTYNRVKATDEALYENGYGDEDTLALKTLNAEKARREMTAEERAGVGNFGYGAVDDHTAALIQSAASEDIVHADLRGMDDGELDAYYERMSELNDDLQNAGADGIDEEVESIDEERVQRVADANGYLPDAVASGEVTVTPDNADEVAAVLSDEIAGTDVTGLTDDEFDELYDRVDAIDDKLRAAGHDGTEELAALADERDYRNQDEDGKYEFGDEYQRSRQVTNWAYDVARINQPEGTDFGMWRAAQYLEDDAFFTGSDIDATAWAKEVLDSPGSYDAFEVGVAQNVADKKAWAEIKSGTSDVPALSDEQLADYESRLNDIDNRMKAEDSPLLSTDYDEDRKISDLHQKLLEEKFARDERVYQKEQAEKEKAEKAEKFFREREERLAREAEERKARGGAGLGGSTFSFENGPHGHFDSDGNVRVTSTGKKRAGLSQEDEKPEESQPQGEKWSVGTVVWAPTKGDTFARVVSITDKTVTLEQLDPVWDNVPRGKRQTFSPGEPTGSTYTRHIQYNDAGEMTCKAGPSRSKAMMVKRS